MASRNFTKQNLWTEQAKIGFLGATSVPAWSEFVWAFEEQLQQLGWFDGNNMRIDYRWAHGDESRYLKLAQDFVRRGVDVIVTSGTPATLAARRATKTIPIVFASAGDPVRTGLIASLKRPGGNVTGSSNGQSNLGSKRLAALKSVVPGLKRLALLGNDSNRVIQLEMEQVLKGARRRGIETAVVKVRKSNHIGPGIRKLRGKADALYVCTDPLVTTHQIAVNTAAASAGLPTMHGFRDYVDNGGLMSYGPDFRAMFAQAANLVDQILRGTDPATIPIKVQKRCELVVNMSTASALGLTVPKGVRRRASLVR